VSNAPSKPVSFSRPKVGYFSNRPRIPLFDSNVNVHLILTNWYIAVSVFLFSKCDKYSELQLFRQAVMKLIMKKVHAIYYLTAEWNSCCSVRVGCLKSHLMMELFLPCILTLQIFLGICMVVESAYLAHHSCLSAHVIVSPTGQIGMKFDLQTWLKSYKYIRHFL